MSLDKVWLIPLCTTICSTAAFFLSYLIAVYHGHVTRIWPYISDSGAMPPESCIFGQLLNLAALFLAATVYLRHRQIVEFYWHRLQQVGRWRAASCALLWVGYTSAFGISMVANFQENNVIFVHYLGAFLAFGCGLIYAWAQTVFSYGMNPKLASPLVSHCRLALCICSSLFFFMTLIFGPILGHQPKHEHANTTACKILYVWTGNETNYREHTVGTVSEWALAICFQLYILSFVVELRHAYCHAPKLKLIAFCEEDSETGMAISQAAINLHRKLSTKQQQSNGIGNGIIYVSSKPVLDHHRRFSKDASTVVGNGDLRTTANANSQCKSECQFKSADVPIGVYTVPVEEDGSLPNDETFANGSPELRYHDSIDPQDQIKHSNRPNTVPCELSTLDHKALAPFGRLRQNESSETLGLAQIQSAKNSNLRNSAYRDSGFLDSSTRGSADDLRARSVSPNPPRPSRRNSETNASENSAAKNADEFAAPSAAAAAINAKKLRTISEANISRKNNPSPVEHNCLPITTQINPKRTDKNVINAKLAKISPNGPQQIQTVSIAKFTPTDVLPKVEKLPANEEFAEISLADVTDISNDIKSTKAK